MCGVAVSSSRWWAAPRQLPRASAADARQGLGQLVAIGLADARSAAVGRQLVGLVEDHQIVGNDVRLLEPGEHPAPASVSTLTMTSRCRRR